MPEFQLTFDWEEIERCRYDPDRLFRSPDSERLSGLPEGQHFERKSARVSSRHLAEAICAFSNSDARGGVIAVGIYEGAIEGFAGVREDKLNKLLRAGPEFCPQALCNPKTVKLDGKTVLLIRVEYHPHRVVELTDGSVYLRSGDQTRCLHPDEVQRLRHEKGEVSFELEVAADVALSDLEPALLSEFAQSVRGKDDLRLDHSTEDILSKRRLVKYDRGRYLPLNAALLLFGKDPVRLFPGCKVRFLRYEGTHARTGAELNVTKDVLMEGPIPKLIKEASDLVASQLREFQALQPDGRFHLLPEYPPDCVHEGIVNACVHRSYSMRNATTFVRMFDDRLEIESPGGFVPPVTSSNIYDHHAPRNPIVMDALRYLRFVRCANEGTRRMRHLMGVSGLPNPEFRQESDRLSKVVVTLRNDIEHRKTWIDKELTHHVGEGLASSLRPEEIRVLNFLAERQRITVSDAYRITTVKTWHSARKVMDGLLEKGLVSEVKSKPRDPKAHFVLAPTWRASVS